MPDAKKLGKCPICRKPADDVFRPFCSKRCADVDLHRWFAGVYAKKRMSGATRVASHRNDDVRPGAGLFWTARNRASISAARGPR